MNIVTGLSLTPLIQGKITLMAYSTRGIESFTMIHSKVRTQVYTKLAQKDLSEHGSYKVS